MRVREVVPADHMQPIVVPNDSIRLSKVAYDDLNYQEATKKKIEEKVEVEARGELDKLEESKEVELGEELAQSRVGIVTGKEGPYGQIESSKTVGLESC
jgi:hypothetical protein